jgi:hypothetical protein
MNKCPVAWIVEVDSIPVIIWSINRSRAKWIAVRGYREAGYRTNGIRPNVKVNRAKVYDRINLEPDRCWSEDYVLEQTLRILPRPHPQPP